MADEAEAKADFLEGVIRTYLDDGGGSPAHLISLLTSFRIMSGTHDERLLLQPLEDLFSSRNVDVDDEGFHIYNIPNRKDSVFGLCYLIGTMDEVDCGRYAKDIITGVQSSACLSLLTIAHLVEDELVESFESIFKALLVQCKTPLDRYPIARKNVADFNRRLALIVAPDPNNVNPQSLQIFIQQFERLGDTLCPRSRRFLISWLLNLLCDAMLSSLPVILTGLFNMISFPKDSPDVSLFKKSEIESVGLIRSFSEKVREGKGDHYVSANIEATVSVVARNLQNPSSENAEAEALKLASLLIRKFPREVFKCAEFETIFLHDLDIPQAHFLMGLHIAIQGSGNLETANRHLYKAIHHVNEATHAMAMVSIFSGNHGVAKVFFDMVYTEGWRKVAEMQQAVSATVGKIKENSTSATFNYKRPACDRSHNIDSKCKSCYMYNCAEELMCLIKG